MERTNGAIFIGIIIHTADEFARTRSIDEANEAQTCLPF